jgi:hypothetical protein
MQKKLFFRKIIFRPAQLNNSRAYMPVFLLFRTVWGQ